MVKLKYVGGRDGVDVPVDGRRVTVDRGGVLEVDEATASVMAGPTWERVKVSRKKAKADVADDAVTAESEG